MLCVTVVFESTCDGVVKSCMGSTACDAKSVSSKDSRVRLLMLTAKRIKGDGHQVVSFLLSLSFSVRCVCFSVSSFLASLELAFSWFARYHLPWVHPYRHYGWITGGSVTVRPPIWANQSMIPEVLSRVHRLPRVVFTHIILNTFVNTLFCAHDP